MKKHTIGFTFQNKRDVETGDFNTIKQKETVSAEPRKSIVHVYFPTRNMNLAYYNDLFDLQVGDIVYVDGKLEGLKGEVTEVNYSFKIKLSDYHKVISKVDTEIAGDFYQAGSHMVTFDNDALPYSKVIQWFKAPENGEEYVISVGSDKKFTINDLGEMGVDKDTAEDGHYYYMNNKICYVCVDGIRGYAIFDGRKPYEIEFDYMNGEISNLSCSCYDGYPCKHQFAAMLQLKELLDFIANNYDNEYRDYFAALYKGIFVDMTMNKKGPGKITLE